MDSSRARRPHRRQAAILAATLIAAATVSASTIGDQPAQAATLGDELVVSSNESVWTRTLDLAWHGFGWVAVWSEHPDHSVSGGVEVHGGDDAIRARLVNLDGSLVGGDFQVAEGGGSKDFPAIAHLQGTSGTNRQESLVVWVDDRDGEDDIWAQLIDTSGTGLSGGNFKLSGSGQDLFPGVAHGLDTVRTGVFLAAWENETADGESDVVGQLVRGPDSLGTLAGGNFTISEDTAGRASAPEVAYDPVNDQFLVVWTDSRGGAADARDIWGQYVDTNGKLVGDNFEIGSSPDLDRAPEVLFHPVAQEYLVAWNHEPGALVEAHLQRVAAAGSPVGSLIVAASGANESPGGLGLDAATGNYIVPINVDRTSIEVQRVAVDGALVGDRTQISTDTASNKGPAATAYGSTPVAPGAGTAAVSEMLMVWRDDRNGDEDFESEVFARPFDVEADTDGDGLLDTWETDGWVDNNGNGVLDGDDFDFSDLPSDAQPDPMRKDLYVEVDWMEVDADGDGDVDSDPDQPGDHTHAMDPGTPGSTPTGTPLDDVIDVFADAPVGNPDGTTGIDLHVDVGQMGGGGPIPETVGVDFDSGFEQVKRDNFDVRRQRVFRYALRKHEGSGRGEIWGNDFWWNYNTATTQATGFMHELGHTVGLRHGGDDNINCKPNYFSIMSYTHQLQGIAPSGTMDYSREGLPTLDESDLDESVTLGDGNFQTMFSAGGSVIGPSADTAGNVAIDWDDDGTPDESGDDVDNNDLTDFDQCGGSSPDEVMSGFDDWPNVRYNFLSSPHFVDGIHTYIEEDGDRSAHIDFIRETYGAPDVETSFTGTAAGIPGDPVSYSLDLSNVGEGPARDTVLTFSVPAGIDFTGLSTEVLTNEANPDGSRTLTTIVENLGSGSETTITLEGELAHPPVAALVTLGARIVPLNALGEEVGGQTRDVSVSTSVEFPDLDAAKSGPAEAAPGEPITHVVDVSNVGTADAASVEVSDTLPAGLVYSGPLDGGAGPSPDLVTPNPDGTTTLGWSLGTIEAGTTKSIEYHLRWSLLADPDASVTNEVTVAYADANGNEYGAETASATTSIVFQRAGDPLPRGLWRVRDHLRTPDALAAVQITDDRYDIGDPPDGVLDDGEAEAALGDMTTFDDRLAAHLLATLLNLADHRIASTTEVSGRGADSLGVTNVRQTVAKAVSILDGGSPASPPDYVDVIGVLDRINKGKGLSGP